MTLLYTAHAIATGGRTGHAETDDKNLVVELGSPSATSTESHTVTNPEQLFACAYAACFGSAVEFAAKQQKIEVQDIEVHADVNLNRDDNEFFISATLSVSIADADDATVQKLVQAAHQLCPYSRSTRSNIEVTLQANGHALTQAA